MEVIDIKEMLSYFKSKIAIIIIIVLIVLFGGITYTMFLQTPKYKSVTSVLLKNDTSKNGYYTTNDVSVNKSLITTYSEIVKSRRVINTVKTNLNLSYSYTELSKMINVSSVAETELIKIEVISLNPEMSKKIADETAKVFTLEIPKLYHISNVSILDDADIAKSPYNIDLKKQGVIYFIVGLVFGFGTVFIIYYFDRTVKTAEQIESKVGLPILGEVQELKKGRK